MARGGDDGHNQNAAIQGGWHGSDFGHRRHGPWGSAIACVRANAQIGRYRRIIRVLDRQKKGERPRCFRILLHGEKPLQPTPLLNCYFIGRLAASERRSVPKGRPRHPHAYPEPSFCGSISALTALAEGAPNTPRPKGHGAPQHSQPPCPSRHPRRPRAPRAPWFSPPLPPAAAPTPAKPSRPPSSLTQPTACRHRLPITLRASLPSPPFPSRPPLSCGRLAKGRPRAVGTGILRSYSCNLSPVSFPAMSLSF